MLMDIIQMLAEPGQRQLIVGGLSGILGAMKAAWELYRNEYFLVVSKCSNDESLSKEERRVENYHQAFTGGSIGIPTLIGLEEATRNNSYLMSSPLVEGLGDFATSVLASHVGENIMIAVVFFVADLKSYISYNKFDN